MDKWHRASPSPMGYRNAFKYAKGNSFDCIAYWLKCKLVRNNMDSVWEATLRRWGINVINSLLIALMQVGISCWSGDGYSYSTPCWSWLNVNEIQTCNIQLMHFYSKLRVNVYNTTNISECSFRLFTMKIIQWYLNCLL